MVLRFVPHMVVMQIHYNLLLEDDAVLEVLDLRTACQKWP